MKEVIPGLYQLNIPAPDTVFDEVSIYLIKGDRGYLLIDTGWGTDTSFSALKKQLTSLSIDIRDINQLAITHAHSDHLGLASKLKQLSEVTIYLHPLERDVHILRQDMNKYLSILKEWLILHGTPASDLPRANFSRIPRTPPVEPDILLQDHEVVDVHPFEFEVIWTPGHSPGHLCFFLRDHGILFSGDHVLPSITSNISLYPNLAPNPLGDFINSLAKIRKLDISSVLPAHGNVFQDLDRRINEIIEHHERRKSEAYHVLRKGPQTAYQICLEMTWMLDMTPHGVPGYTLEPLNRRLAILETLAHLELLKFDGEIDSYPANNTVLYQRKN